MPVVERPFDMRARSLPRSWRIGAVTVALLLGVLLLGGLISGSRRPHPAGGRTAPAAIDPERDGLPRATRRDPRRSPRGSISGRVTDPAGRPLPEALVCADASSPDLVSAELR